MHGEIYIGNEQDQQKEKNDAKIEAKVESPKADMEATVESSGKLSPFIQKFLSVYENRLKVAKSAEGIALKVSEVLGGLARLYERIRTTVEYKGEHVLRRNAIERILKRRVWQQGTISENIDPNIVAEALVKELIWARYLPNDSVKKSKIDKVSEIVGKYLYLFKNLDNIPPGLSISDARRFFWGIASSEIEDVLDPSYRELYVNLMYDWFTARYKWSDPEISDHDKSVQVYLSIHRTHAKSDDPIMRYHLLLKELPGWHDADIHLVNKLILNFPKIYSEIQQHLGFHGSMNLYRRMQKHSPAFDIFREIAVSEKLGLRALLEDKEKFEAKVQEICEQKYSQISKKVSTGIVRSIIYIFLTKVVFAMLIEIPYEVFMYNEIRYIPLGINIIFPPIMMWIIGMSTKIPGAKNTDAIISRLQSVIYPDSNAEVQSFSVMSATRNRTLSMVFSLFYIGLFLLVFGGLTYTLTLLHFSLFGMLIFFFFLSLVMLFAYRVRYHAVQLRIDSQAETFYEHLINYLTLPFLNFGFYLSKGLSKINFMTVILDFIIEAPLKSIIGVFEEWTSFIKEKKEEIVEQPDQ